MSFSSLSELEWKKGSVVGQDTGGYLKQVHEGLSLAGETVNDVLLVVGNWRLKEEWQIGKDWTHLLAVNFHSGEQVSKNNHIVHQRYGKQRVLADIVGADSVGTIQENLRWVFIESSLWITNEWDILNDDLVVNLVLTFGVELAIALNCVVKNTCLWDLLGSKGLVFRQVLAIIVTQMVVGDNWGETEARTDNEIAHDCLKACLTTLEVVTCK